MNTESAKVISEVISNLGECCESISDQSVVTYINEQLDCLTAIAKGGVANTESKPEMVIVPRATLEQWSDLAGEWNDVSKKWVYEEIQELIAATPAPAAPQEMFSFDGRMRPSRKGKDILGWDGKRFAVIHFKSNSIEQGGDWYEHSGEIFKPIRWEPLREPPK